MSQLSRLHHHMKHLICAGLAMSLLVACPTVEDDTGTDNTTNTHATQNNETGSDEVKAFTPAIGKVGGKRVIASSSLPKTFNAYLAAETSSTDVIGQMYLGLVTTNPVTTQIEPSLAESWEISDDKKSYTFKLRDGLKWSDGQPITVDDVVFTYNEIIDNKLIPNNYRDGLLVEDQFPKVEKIDESHVKFTTAVPFVPFLRGLSDPIMPKHVFDGTTVEKDGKVAFNTMWGLSSDVTKIIVNGPWKVKAYVAGQRVVLEPNPHYYQKDAEGNTLPYLTEFVTTAVQDLNTSVIKFDAGETDSLALRPEDYDLLAPKQDSGGFKIKNLGPATGTTFVMFNMSTAKNEKGEPVVDPVKSKWFRNIKFRQALAHAINKKGIIDSIYKGRATPQTSHISQQNPFYNPTVKEFEYNLETAQNMLAEAGFVKDGEVLKDPDGNTVEFNLVTNAGNTLRDATCAILRKDWGKLGVQVNYKPVQFNVMVQQIDQTLDWEAMMIGLTGSAIEPHFGINSWRLDGRMHMFNMGHESRWKGAPTSFQEWESQVLALYEQAAQEFDFEKRKQLYGEAQEIVAEQLPFLYTANSFSMVAYRNNLGNVRPSIHGGSGLNQINWNTEQHFIKE